MRKRKRYIEKEKDEDIPLDDDDSDEIDDDIDDEQSSGQDDELDQSDLPSKLNPLSPRYLIGELNTVHSNLLEAERVLSQLKDEILENVGTDDLYVLTDILTEDGVNVLKRIINMQTDVYSIRESIFSLVFDIKDIFKSSK